jgi:hypothetical protein
MTTARSRALGSVIAIAAIGCGVDTGNGLATATVKMALISSDNMAALSGRDMGGNTLSLSSGLAGVDRIDFYLPGAMPCANNDLDPAQTMIHCDAAKIRIDGPLVFDLKTGLATPSLEAIRLPALTFSRVDVSFKMIADPPLSGATLTAAGSMTANGTATPFDLSLRFTDVARFDSATGVTLTRGAPQEVLLALDVAQWFTALPIGACAQHGDLDVSNGRVQVHNGRGQCTMLESALHDAVDASGHLEP